jgi:hypothetical protein
MFRSLLDLKFVSLGISVGKSAGCLKWQFPREAKSFILRDRAMRQSTFPRKFSKLIYTKSVPQTDTGDQVE